MKTHDQLGIAILRIVVGIVFFAHGWQKLFVYGFPGVTGSFGHMGIPLPAISGPLVTLVEFLGGIALMLGIATRWAAILLAIDMLVAVLKVHLPGGFFMPRGIEFAFTLLAANVALALAGPGRPAFDRLIRGRRSS